MGQDHEGWQECGELALLCRGERAIEVRRAKLVQY